MRNIWIQFLLCAATFGADQGFKSNWDSLKQHPIPAWLIDAKFGIYAHWGVYSVPAFANEWYARRMYDPKDPKGTYEHHRQTWGPQEKFGYKDFVPMFKAEKFDPDRWAEIISQSGARYAGIAVVHHDGFNLWKSKVSRWNVGEMGPHRDLYGDLVKSLRAKNLKIIATEHNMRTFGWYLPPEPYLEQARKAQLDLFDPQYADLYWNQFTSTKAQFVAQWKAKLFEVIDNYRPDVLWFDGGDFQSDDVAAAVTTTLAHYYNTSPGVEVLNKFAGTMKFNFPRDVGMLTFEAGRDRPAEVDRPWIDDLSIGKNSWGYIDGLELQDAGDTIRGFVDRVSRGGGLLLSLAPTASGEIPPDQRAFLREMGDWLKVNGEAIYDTRPWKVAAEGDTQKLIAKRGQHTAWRFDNTTAQDIRFTQKPGRIYAIALGWPEDGKLRIKSLTQRPKRVTMLGASTPLKWSHSADGLIVETPSQRPCKYAFALRIE